MNSNQKVLPRDVICLNCNYPIIGNYCNICGQKAHLHKDSFWHMALHFIGDYFHYDGKFWLTIKTMFTKPGKVTLDFIQGKRARFLNPISFYIFVSTVFFLFLLPSVETEPEIIASYKPIENTVFEDSATTLSTNIGYSTNSKTKFNFGKWTPKEFETHQDYFNDQAKKAKHQKDSWLKKLFIKKYFKLKFLADSGQDIEAIYASNLKNAMPKAFFILLPFFAFLLHIFFRNKKLFYVDHVIHSIHLHIILFLLFGISIRIGEYGSEYSSLVLLLIGFIGVVVYFSLSIKKVYASSWPITLLKEIFIVAFYLIAFLIALISLLFISILMF